MLPLLAREYPASFSFQFSFSSRVILSFLVFFFGIFSYKFSHSLAFPSPPLLTPRFHPTCLSTDGQLHNFIPPVSPPRLGVYYPGCIQVAAICSIESSRKQRQKLPWDAVTRVFRGAPALLLPPNPYSIRPLRPVFHATVCNGSSPPTGGPDRGRKAPGPRRRLCSSWPCLPPSPPARRFSSFPIIRFWSFSRPPCLLIPPSSPCSLLSRP